MTTANGSNEITLIRVFDAPVKTVWEAWTDADQVKQWWGPRGFTLTTHHKETKTGGAWSYTMHGPDGVDYENTTQYLLVEPLKKLVYDHGGHKDRPPLFRVTVLFSELAGGKTKMSMTSTLPSAEEAEKIRVLIKKAGGESTWDRLAEYLEKQRSGAERFVIARAFSAPVAHLFDLWTQPEHLAQWLPPVGFTMTFIERDIRVGGTSFYVMSNGAMKLLGMVRYLAIDPPRRLVYTQQFADEKKALSRHPMAPVWPATLLTTVDFAEEAPNRTRVTVTWEPHGPVSPEELEVFIRMRGSMTQGWTGSFDKLESYLSSSGRR